MVSQAVRAEQMRHVLPPRTGGVTAALEAAPHADVVLVAHAGLEGLSTLADLWDGLPMDGAVRLCWWFVPAQEVPAPPGRAGGLAVRALGRAGPLGRLARALAR
jgi:hypothetical protein